MSDSLKDPELPGAGDGTEAGAPGEGSAAPSGTEGKAAKAAKASKKAAKNDVAVPALGFWGMVRWAWTQLTTMKTALFLLLLLAVAAVPGSLFPQRSQSPEKVVQYLKDNPFWGNVLDKMQFFDVFTSAWFSAIYLLLFISLVGCVMPRTKQHWQASKRPPARTPARFNRLPESGALALPEDAPSDEEVIKRLGKVLKSRRYRVQTREAQGKVGASVGAERGYSREWGNLLFHYSLVGVLISVAVGGMFGYSGQRILVEGEGFTNTLVSYDQFSPGNRFNAETLAPFSVQLNKFSIEFNRQERTDGKYGTPVDYTAEVTVKDGPNAESRDETIKVNHPLRVDGADVYLVGNGYAPVITVKDSKGKVAYQGPVVAVPQDGTYMSLMVLKVPDTSDGEQLAFQGFLLPTTLVNADGAAYSGDPDANNPTLQLNSYYGDLGLDDGTPQNVYVLDTKKLKELNNRKLDVGGIVLGDTEQTHSYELPDGKGTISFDGLKRYIGIEIHRDPGKAWVGTFAVLAVLGLAISLFVPRRRVWFKLADNASGTEGGGRMLEYGLLARGEDPRLAAEAKALRDLLKKEFPGITQVEVTSTITTTQRTLRD